MSEKVLSQEEISALLAAVGKEEPKAAAEPKPVAGERSSKKHLSALDQEGYLFPMTRAQVLSKELEAALLLIFDAFAHKGSATFSHNFRTQVSFKLHDVEQVFYGDFIESLPEPSSIWYLEVKPHSQHVAVCLEPPLVNSIVSVMLGGSPTGEVRGRNMITDLEQNIVETAVAVFCRELRHAWSRVSEVEIEIDNRETRPRLLRIYPPNEVMVVLGMAMRIGQTEGTMYWGLPTNLLKTLQDQVSHQRQVESREKLVETVNRVKELALTFQTELEARLVVTPVTLDELLSLKPGDILKLEHMVGEPAEVLVNGRRTLFGDIVVARDHRTVRVG
ncbi:MAG: flagellar motor switch protein FliM [Acidobacteriota bacterium]